MNDFLIGALWALTPTVLVGALFWLIIRSILTADRAERAAFTAIEASERARVNDASRSANPDSELPPSVRL